MTYLCVSSTSLTYLFRYPYAYGHTCKERYFHDGKQP